jgi:nucleoside phosphorylase
MTINEQRVDFVLVTALPEERDALLEKLPGYRQLPPVKDDIRTYFQVDLPVTFPDNSTGKYRVMVMCLLGMGRVQAVTATADAIRRWRPRYILMVGIAGGMATRNIRIGDILISDQIVDYELQKLTSQGAEIRWDVQRADPRLLDACNNYRGEHWQELIQIRRPDKAKPKRYTGPIASGDKVITFDNVLAGYRDVWPKLIGVEMEAAGVATAAFQSSVRPGFFMVRGVSDLADENKGSSNVEKWRSYACDIAASFAIALLKSGPVPLAENPIQVRTKRVEIILDGEFSEFTLNQQQDIVRVLAALLSIDSGDIRILKVYSGSIVIIVEMPDNAANRLYEMATTRDFRIMSLIVKSVLVEGRAIINLDDKTIGVLENRPEQQLQIGGQEARVLILDDEEPFRKIITEIVIDAGFIPIPVDNLRDARKVINDGKIDIVVTDVSVEGAKKGLWLLDDIRKMHLKLKRGPLVIVISGSDLMGRREMQQITVNYRDIVVAFFAKDDFNDGQMVEVLTETIRKKQESASVGDSALDFESDDLVYSIQDQPWFMPYFPTTIEIDFIQLEALVRDIDVVLITATDEEIKAVMRMVEPYPRRRGILKTFVGPETYYLGKFGEYRAVVTKCRVGAIGEGSVILATEQAQRIWRPRAVIMVGIAFGKDPQKQAMADVMVASQIISYEQQRVGDRIIFRGPITPSNPVLLNRFTNVPGWHFTRPDGKVCKIHVDPILSGEKLVDDPKFKAELFNQYPQAIGGEMEGAGLCAATGRMGVPWILVKAISDWGDGKKHNKHQPLAAAAATSLVHYVLSQKTALNSINKPIS